MRGGASGVRLGLYSPIELTPSKEEYVAKVWTLKSDFTGKEIEDKMAATVTVRFEDGRKGVYVADAHANDPVVKEVVKVGRAQQRRGRKPAAK
jgi:hypothetical protein